MALAGVFNADGVQTLSSGTSDLNDAGTASSQSLSGNFTFAAGNAGGAQPRVPAAVQIPDHADFQFLFRVRERPFFMEVDAPGTPFPMPPRLSGEMILQQPQRRIRRRSLRCPGRAWPPEREPMAPRRTSSPAFCRPDLQRPDHVCPSLRPKRRRHGDSPAPLSGTCTATPNGRVAFNLDAAAGHHASLRSRLSDRAGPGLPDRWRTPRSPPDFWSSNPAGPFSGCVHRRQLRAERACSRRKRT